MRTFLDGVKGDLFVLARQSPEENMTWETMTARVAQPKGETEYREVLRQESIRSNLVSRLSEIGKDRRVASGDDLLNLWTQTLDHVYVLLTLTV